MRKTVEALAKKYIDCPKWYEFFIADLPVLSTKSYTSISNKLNLYKQCNQKNTELDVLDIMEYDRQKDDFDILTYSHYKLFVAMAYELITDNIFIKDIYKKYDMENYQYYYVCHIMQYFQIENVSILNAIKCLNELYPEELKSMKYDGYLQNRFYEMSGYGLDGRKEKQLKSKEAFDRFAATFCICKDNDIDYRMLKNINFNDAFDPNDILNYKNSLIYSDVYKNWAKKEEYKYVITSNQTIIDNFKKTMEQTGTYRVSISEPSYTFEIHKAYDLKLNFILEWSGKTDIYAFENEILYDIGHNKNKTTIVVYHNGDMYISIRDKFRPLTIKDLCRIWKCYPIKEVKKLFQVLEGWYVENNEYIMKDIFTYAKKDLCLLPVTINEARKYHNMKELMYTKYPTKLNPNKYDCNYLYIQYKCMPYIKTNCQNAFMEMYKPDIMDYEITGKKKLIKHYLTKFVKRQIEQYEPKNNQEWNRDLIKDYITMCVDNKVPVNLKIKSYKKLEQAHNDLSNELLMKASHSKQEKLVDKKKSKFVRLRTMLPEEFEWITNNKRLQTESTIMGHCVWSYADRIKKDKCAIYSMFYKPDNCRYTIEFGLKNKQYTILQIQKKYNQGYSCSVREYIQNLLSAEKR